MHRTTVLRMAALVAFAFAIGLVPAITVYAAACPTGPDGVISTDTTWSTDCELGVDGATVNPGVTLTIDAGVAVRMTNPNSRINVAGTLNAQGTPVLPVRFTSGESVPEPGDWGRIVLQSGSVGNVLNQVVIEYGGYGIDVDNPVLDIRTSAATLTNITVRDVPDMGIRIHAASPTLDGITFASIGVGSSFLEAPLQLEGASQPALSNLDASGTTFDSIVLSGVTYNADETWGNAGITNYTIDEQPVTGIDYDITVATGVTLTILPGTTVYAGNPNGDLLISGTLRAAGTTDQPIRFTSLKTHPAHADTPAPGDWGSLRFRASSDNSLIEHAVVEYGGGIFGGLEIASSGVLVRHSTIARNGNAGIRVTDSAPAITRSSIVENTGLGGRGLVNEGTATVSATCNWWGAASGPESDANPVGAGQRVIGSVIFSPWLVDAEPGGACTGRLPTVFLPLVIR